MIPISLPIASAAAPPLQFGIYPGGGAGSVAGKADPLPEVPAARTAALEGLRGGHSLGVHLYTQFTGDAARDRGDATWMADEISRYTAAGLRVELVLRYKPVGGADPQGFAQAVRAAVDRYGTDPLLTSLQVTNEANIPGAPDASDGAFPGAIDALVAGIVAAKDEVRRTGHSQIRVGFNWASDGRTSAGADFWSALGRKGGPAFAAAVDWVGLDSYPGTWYPSLPLTSVLPSLTTTALQDAVRGLRSCHMPLAGLGAGVAIHISENGWPTGPGRSAATQAAVLDAMVRGVNAWRGTYHVTDYNWFDLRDSRTSDPSIESQYGLMTDTYRPKPAYGTYRNLIAELGGAGSGVGNAGCSPSPVKVSLPAPKGVRLQSLRVIDGTTTVRTLSLKHARKATVSALVRLAPGVRRLSLRVRGTRRGRTVNAKVRRAVTVCSATTRRKA